jgi:hypothetical protein
MTMTTPQVLGAMLAGMQVLDTFISTQNQASAQRQQAAMAERQAQRERAIAAQQAEDFRRRQSAGLASARARQAASGVALAGSPLLADDAAQQEIALGEARVRGGGEARAASLEEDAIFARRQASRAVPMGFLRAGQTLLSAAERHYR